MQTSVIVNFFRNGIKIQRDIQRLKYFIRVFNTLQHMVDRYLLDILLV